jgi:hypothetical protein
MPLAMGDVNEERLLAAHSEQPCVGVGGEIAARFFLADTTPGRKCKGLLGSPPLQCRNAEEEVDLLQHGMAQVGQRPFILGRKVLG